MKRLTIVGSAVVAVVIILVIVFVVSRHRAFQPVPTSCPAPKTPIKCPEPGDVDANGCPKGGYDESKGECEVTFKYYQDYAGCKDEHQPMTFYPKASPGNPSKYHLISATAFDIQAAFTEIDCTKHTVVGAVNAGKPFQPTGDDFSDFKSEHISGDAMPSPDKKDKCFKVTVNLSGGPDCVDPHIIVKGQ